ncbi:CPBP family intramembrane glutamic endopeptidase [Tsuneonella amylolytica]|uniref:CPBP family intramembrane glutamic endopeptidase n=1 Tax=Tsuneonella amylolytica TaxID=2338327 RepID=UPI000EA8F1DD|nr:type II CAAX endopeptidase family protein [Tsuneonella amylolytica]
MDDAAAPADSTDPFWKRVWQFPLVAMMAALFGLAVVFATLTLVLSVAFAGLAPTGVQIVNGLAVPVVTVVFAKVVLTRLGERPRDEFAFPGAVRQVAIGLAGSAALISAIVGVVALLGGYRLVGWGGATSWPLLIFVAGLQAGFLEELLFRGILFRFLEDFGGSWFALALTSALFGAVHLSNPNATAVGAIGIAVSAGLLLGGSYMLTRSLWLPVALHAGWNMTQGMVWDVPVSGNPVDGIVEAHPAGSVLVSGGAFGVEASVVAMVLAGAAGAWLIVLAARRGEPMRPLWVRRRLQREGAPVPVEVPAA